VADLEVAVVTPAIPEQIIVNVYNSVMAHQDKDSQEDREFVITLLVIINTQVELAAVLGVLAAVDKMNVKELQTIMLTVAQALQVIF
jgi:hypothetical protein